MLTTINWFEIPVYDLDRAVRFYEQALGLALKRETFEGTPIALFPAVGGGAGGALVQDSGRQPSGDGVLAYLDAEGKLDAIIDRLEGVGGNVILPKTDVGDPGYIALFGDTEGNVVGLHAPR